MGGGGGASRGAGASPTETRHPPQDMEGGAEGVITGPGGSGT